MATAARLDNDAIPSSSPAFGTPALPFNPPNRPLAQPAFRPNIPTILPILLPPPSLRPLTYRTLQRYSLNLNTTALQALATFVGKHCGSGWREEGTAEKVIEEVARSWKKCGGRFIVEDGPLLKSILKTLEGCMTGGRIVPGKSGLSRQSSFAFAEGTESSDGTTSRPPLLEHQSSSYGLGGLNMVDDEAGEESEASDPRSWLKVVDAYSQPRLLYNVHKKHFERITTAPTLLPSPNHKTTLFRDRYNLIHQRLLRNPMFQAPSVQGAVRSLNRSDSTTQLSNYRITPIANLLGRGGTTHLLLGMLVVTPTGTLAIQDLSGGITLDLAHTKPVGDLSRRETPWFCPGMIVLIEGSYQEEYSGAGSSGLGSGGGVGGTIGGKFIGFTIGGPPCEKRAVTLGISGEGKDKEDVVAGGAFGWTDFLGLGSEKAVGTRMRRLEKKLLRTEKVDKNRRRMVILGETNLDDPACLESLRKVLDRYVGDTDALPLGFVLVGNFVSHAVMAGGGSGSGGGSSIEYKEYFNDLAAVLSDYPELLRSATWVFVPGDNDPWPAAFSTGASVPVPRKEVPALFTSRIKRAFASAKAEGPKSDVGGEAVWASNPARVTLFGPAHEIVVFRDDISGRLRRNAVNFGKAAREDEDEDEGGGVVAASVDADVVMSGDDAPGLDEQQDDINTTTRPAAPNADGNTQFARKLILSLLPQSHLSPFPLATRPVHWDYASVLSLYPLPHALVMADAEAPPFAITYEGCHVMNPSRLVREEGRTKRVTWIEYDALTKRGEVKEMRI